MGLGSFQLTMYPDGNAAAAAHSITFAPADNISSAGLTKVQSATVLNSGTLSGNFVSITVSHTGTLPIGVSAGPAFGGGKNLVDGTYIVSYIPGGLVLPPGVTVDLPLTYTVAPDSPQGESGTVTVTANGVS